MRAAILQDGKIEVGQFPDPTPEQGQVVVKTHRCALCASDAHFLTSGHTVVERSQASNGPYAGIDMSRPIVMGHEYVGEIVEYGSGSRKPLPVGTRVTSIPGIRISNGFGIVGYYPECPGGFGEYMLLDEDLMLEVSTDIDLDLAALIEPLAVGFEHARAVEAQPNDVALVMGCGAIGLSVIAALRTRGIGPIVASDFSAERRELAKLMGADVVVDPREQSPFEPFEALGNRAPNLIYECVGRKGVMTNIIDNVQPSSRIVMGGYCLDPEEIYVPTAQNKRLQIQFAGGEMPEDMVSARDAIQEGKIDLRPWLGEGLGLADVEDALKRMSDPSEPIRRVVDPTR